MTAVDFNAQRLFRAIHLTRNSSKKRRMKGVECLIFIALNNKGGNRSTACTAKRYLRANFDLAVFA